MKTTGRPIVIVQGAQWGSESKGMVSLALCERLGSTYAVRTGSINAGHTVVMDGKRLVFQQLPTAAVLKDVCVLLGPGTYVHERTLINEIKQASSQYRTFIDRNCGVHLDEYTEEATKASRNLKIGATGKGCAEAIIHKIKDRGVGTPLLFRDRMVDKKFVDNHTSFCDVAKIITSAYRNDQGVLIEGTQGTLLDLHTGPYPFTTSRQTISSAWVSECGLSPALSYEVVLVARTFPIRVAGNSGPMERETTWPSLARKMNRRLDKLGVEPVVKESSLLSFEARQEEINGEMKWRGKSASEISLTSATETLLSLDQADRDELLKLFETTTVTKRLRRVAELDREQLRDTVFKEAPSYLVLTFLNYVFPELRDKMEIHGEAMDYLRQLRKDVDCPIRFVSTGPASEHLVEIEDKEIAS